MGSCGGDIINMVFREAEYRGPHRPGAGAKFGSPSRMYCSPFREGTSDTTHRWEDGKELGACDTFTHFDFPRKPIPHPSCLIFDGSVVRKPSPTHLYNHLPSTMSQLAVPGRNAARQAKKLKEIRKVKHAIQWRIMWENEHVHQVRKKALANAKEDWKLGPLRPNRAIGPGADKYGALTGNQMQKPEIPTRTQRNRNETRAKKGLELEYPLVVKARGAKDKDVGKKYFPIVKDDRVVILKGKDRSKIGVVQEVIERTHEVIIKGLNTVCITYARSIRAKLLTAPSNTTTLMSSPKLVKKWAQSTRTKCLSPWTTYAS
jgi:hypothetical protein